MTSDREASPVFLEDIRIRISVSILSPRELKSNFILEWREPFAPILRSRSTKAGGRHNQRFDGKLPSAVHGRRNQETPTAKGVRCFRRSRAPRAATLLLWLRRGLLVVSLSLGDDSGLAVSDMHSLRCWQEIARLSGERNRHRFFLLLH